MSENDIIAVKHNNADDPAEPFLSDLVGAGQYKCSNTPNGNVYGKPEDVTAGDSPFRQFFGDGPWSFSGFPQNKWDGNRSGE